MEIKTVKFISSWFAFGVLVFLLFFLLFISIFQPAYYSMISSCVPNGDEIVEDAGYELAGYAYVPENQTNEEEPEAEVVILNDTPSTRKHEQCHVVQYAQNRVYSCSSFFGRFITEVECYTVENLPGFVYKPFYGNYENVESA